MSQGFLTVQHSIAMSSIQYILHHLKREADPIFGVHMSRYPYPPYIDDKFIVALKLFFPMIICFSFIYPAVNIVKNLVVEKEKRIKVRKKYLCIYTLKYSIVDCLFPYKRDNTIIAVFLI